MRRGSPFSVLFPVDASLLQSEGLLLARLIFSQLRSARIERDEGAGGYRKFFLAFCCFFITSSSPTILRVCLSVRVFAKWKEKRESREKNQRLSSPCIRLGYRVVRFSFPRDGRLPSLFFSSCPCLPNLFQDFSGERQRRADSATSSSLLSFQAERFSHLRAVRAFLGCIYTRSFSSVASVFMSWPVRFFLFFRNGKPRLVDEDFRIPGAFPHLVFSRRLPSVSFLPAFLVFLLPLLSSCPVHPGCFLSPFLSCSPVDRHSFLVLSPPFFLFTLLPFRLFSSLCLPCTSLSPSSLFSLLSAPALAAAVVPSPPHSSSVSAASVFRVRRGERASWILLHVLFLFAENGFPRRVRGRKASDAVLAPGLPEDVRDRPELGCGWHSFASCVDLSQACRALCLLGKRCHTKTSNAERRQNTRARRLPQRSQRAQCLLESLSLQIGQCVQRQSFFPTPRAECGQWHFHQRKTHARGVQRSCRLGRRHRLCRLSPQIQSPLSDLRIASSSCAEPELSTLRSSLCPSTRRPEPPSSSLPCIAPRSRSESPRGSSKLGTKSESHASSSHSSSTRETRAYSRSRSREGDERRGRRRSRWSSRQEKKKKAPSRSPSRSSSRSSRSSRRSRKKRSGWTDASSEEKKREELDAQMNEIIANAQSAKAKQDAEKRMQSALDASLQAGALTNPMNSAGLNLTIGRGLSLLNCGTPAAVAQRAAQAAADRLLSPSPLAQAAVLNLLASNPGLAGLVGASQAPTSSGLSVQEKRKLLWGKKSEKESEKEKAGEDSENGKDEKVVDPNRYSLSFRGDEEKKHKFLKLMGFKGEAQQPQPSTAAVTTAGKEALDSAAQQKMNSELEFQYFQGIKRKDGRKTGLGL
ncbi:hypothetical protein TGPRC2_235740 [Toxoplasma gondii TgCatPRC2]|uniref:Small acidic protein-like domain-containing protein n=3 Tax=Toxoplasma gondii TaxID=5811 RepID=A0A151H4J6_TOXGO|nr:hypothetical protein TGME49_235740 [Toxoplasma gondii ME49]EPT26710.1 hypothetical protein TGME49_235740 [Toxoplasma gondii ME49]KFG31587.1 hypothetical protein TGDOM2_235740 [Toxoplasma gondii GAB2-2007-GAL-DOM2]KYK64259.1 hypothetical protein TGPRC2_235740 [Toxoplasma gondii TgCatPRC2]|eukprot:XP_002368969.2 hypothetical protein TGME49_235740 [Toxoplasma gondii ME49]